MIINPPIMRTFGNTIGSSFSNKFSVQYREYFLANFAGDLTVTKGTGPITYARASAYYNIQDAYWTKVLSGVPGYTDLLGIDIHPLSTNKCECWGFPRADAYGSTLTSGTAALGKVYEIVTITAIDWDTVGTLLSGTANTVGAKYVITGTLTFTADDTGKEAIDAVGTKAYHDGAIFQNPITGMTLTGDTAAVLSIVEDQVALEAMTVEQLDNLVNGWKDYDVTTGAGGSATVTLTGAMAATATSMSAYVRVLSGSCVIQDSTGTYDVTPSGTAFVRYKEESFTPTAGSTLQIVVAASSQVRFLAPQVESLPYTTPLNPSEGATSTRAAIDVSAPMTGNYPLTGSRHIPVFEWTPSAMATGVVQCLWSSVTDANNYVAIWLTGSTEIKVEKMVGGVSEETAYTGTFVNGTTYKVDAGFYANNKMNLQVDGSDATVDTSTTAAPVFDATQWIGSFAGANHMSGNIKNLSITNQRIITSVQLGGETVVLGGESVIF